MDYNRVMLNPSMRYVFPLFVFLHALVVLLGSGGNMGLLVVIGKRRLFRDPTYLFLANLAVSDFIKAALVLPLTLANLLLQGWVFGSFLCYALSMLQTFPIHASMLTYVLLAADRYRLVVHPMKSRLPAGLCVLGVWIVSICVVLPFAAYIKYFDLELLLGPQFKGMGFCVVNQERRVEEYLRAMFVVFYCLPLAVIAFLFIRVSAEIKALESAGMMSSGTEEAMPSTSETSYQSRATLSTAMSEHGRIEPEGASGDSGLHRGYSGRFYLATDADEIDMKKEKRGQRYLITMVTLFAICWCPINLLILVTHFVMENEDNSGHFDITYATLTFIGYLSTCMNPTLFAYWHMSDSTRDRLRGYFRFSNRRRSSEHSDSPRRRELLNDNFRNGYTSHSKDYL